VYYQEALSNRERQYLDRAKKVAKTSKCRVKHGAIIVSGNSILSFAVNRDRNNPCFVDHPKRDASVHAEIGALRMASKTKGAVMYIARVNNQGEPRMSRPCAKCMEAIKAAGIKRIVYTVQHAEDFDYENKEKIS